jgi:hypothetical protein
LHASYAISVRRASALPAASFRFHLAMDTLAVRLTVPPVGSVGDFHSLVSAPCRAHKMKRQATLAIACLYLNLSHLLKGGPSEASEYMPVLLVWQYFFQTKT